MQCTILSRQVPWDHSALTGDFYFRLASALGAVPKVAPPDSSAEATANIFRLEQLNERLRQLDEANRADQQRIFETHRKYPASDPASRAAASREVGAIQLQMVRRNEDRRKLSDQIAKLEAEVGLAQGAK